MADASPLKHVRRRACNAGGMAARFCTALCVVTHSHADSCHHVMICVDGVTQSEPMISTPIGGTHLESGGGAAGGTPPTATRAWVCCHPIPGDLLPIALHCGIAYECTDPLSGNQTICVCSANPVGLLKDMPVRNVRNRDCDSWWPWHGAWGPIVPYCRPMDSDHPDYWLWKGSPALAIGALHRDKCMRDLTSVVYRLHLK